MKKLSICGMAFLGLTACGASQASYDDLLDSLEDRTDRNEDIAGTPSGNIPTSGSADYSGEGVYTVTALGQETSFISEAEVSVSFRSDTVTGELSNFYDEDAESYSGTVSVESGGLDRTGQEVLAVSELEGSLRGPNGERIVVDGAMVAGFGNNDASVLAGFVGGDLTIDGASGSFEGVIVMEE